MPESGEVEVKRFEGKWLEAVIESATDEPKVEDAILCPSGDALVENGLDQLLRQAIHEGQ